MQVLAVGNKTGYSFRAINHRTNAHHIATDLNVTKPRPPQMTFFVNFVAQYQTAPQGDTAQ